MELAGPLVLVEELAGPLVLVEEMIRFQAHF